MAQQLIIDVEDQKVLNSLLELLGRIKGVSIIKSFDKADKKRPLSAYEQSLKDIEEGHVTTYESVEDFYQKMGI